MTKIKLNNLKNLSDKEKQILSGYKGLLMVCAGTGCVSAKGLQILDELKESIRSKGLDKDLQVEI